MQPTGGHRLSHNFSSYVHIPSSVAVLDDDDEAYARRQSRANTRAHTIHGSVTPNGLCVCEPNVTVDAVAAVGVVGVITGGATSADDITPASKPLTHSNDNSTDTGE